MKLSLLFGYLFHIGALLAIVFSLHVRDTTAARGRLCYAGSALGAVFAGDLITLFVILGTARSQLGVPDLGATQRTRPGRRACAT